MTWNTSPQCSREELFSVEQGETQIIRSAELYEYPDLLRSVEVRVEIRCVHPENVSDHLELQN